MKMSGLSYSSKKGTILFKITGFSHCIFLNKVRPGEFQVARVFGIKEKTSQVPRILSRNHPFTCVFSMLDSCYYKFKVIVLPFLRVFYQIRFLHHLNRTMSMIQISEKKHKKIPAKNRSHGYNSRN